MSDVAAVELAVQEWAAGRVPSGSSRVASALRSCHLAESSGVLDVAVLIRQVLRSSDSVRALAESGASVQRNWVTVPTGTVLDVVDWATLGITCRLTVNNRLELRADPWCPAWLPDVPDNGCDAEVSARQQQRRDETVPPDPFLTEIDSSIETYRTAGQRSAVRSAFLMAPASTLLVNLPTGVGKTLPLLARALLTPPGKTSVVIVPTVALALDQQRRFREQRPGTPSTAYYGDLSKERKAEFVERIRGGNQPVLFTNPEAAVTSLAGPLADAAAGGRLELFAIDEAHVVASWGDAFRPHFQMLAGLRNALVRRAVENDHPVFRTILTSATLTEGTVELLRLLFGSPGPFMHLAAPVTRPEPSFWFAECPSAEVQLDRLVETLLHLPRPTVVYTTLRDGDNKNRSVQSPAKLVEALKDRGLSRVAAVDGGTKPERRGEILNGFRGDGNGSDYDLVVATSAFGLGIDVSDIRAVVHACLPESLDRFYQEVGRAGRDGRSSISIVLSTGHDRKVAESMASPSMVTPENARKRWRAMNRKPDRLPDGRVRLPITAVHPDLTQNSDYNETWNLFTIGLLARSRVLRWELDLACADDDDPSGWLTVELLRSDHGLDSLWNDEVDPIRNQILQASKRSLSMLQQALHGDQCVGDLLASHYSISTATEQVKALRSCAGCPNCRRQARSRAVSPSPMPRPLGTTGLVNKSRLNSLAAPGRFGRRITLVDRAGELDSKRNLRRFIEDLVLNEGVRLLIADSVFLDALEGKLPGIAMTDLPPLFVERIETFEPQTAPGVSTLVIVGPKTPVAPLLDGIPGIPLTTVLVKSSGMEDRAPHLRNQDATYDLKQFERLR